MRFLERLPTEAPQSDEAQLQHGLSRQGQICEMRAQPPPPMLSKRSPFSQPGREDGWEQLHQARWEAFSWLESSAKSRGQGRQEGARAGARPPCFNVAGCSDVPTSPSWEGARVVLSPWHYLHCVPRSPEQRGLLPLLPPAEPICPSLKLPPFPELPWEPDSGVLALKG